MFIILVQIALGNILKFRKKNWQFDFIGGIIYFLLAFSMFPQVNIFLVIATEYLDSVVKKRASSSNFTIDSKMTDCLPPFLV